MVSAIIKKVEGWWIVDKDSNHIFEEDGVYGDGAYQEITISRRTPLRKHPNDPGL